jgi:hypothetical protein
MSDVAVESQPPILSEIVPPPRAWLGRSLEPEEFLVPFSKECLEELEGVIAAQRSAPVPTFLLATDQFRLDACKHLMKKVRHILDHGPGFAILDRLPLDTMSEEEATDLYWLLANFIEPPVAQEWKGTIIIHVRNDEEDFTQDTRGTVTPTLAPMHTDSSMAEAPPNYFGLMCMQKAKSGGLSSAASILAAHNHFNNARPDLLRRLYRPFYRDHKDFQAPDAAARNFQPIFAWNGKLTTRLSFSYIYRGYERTGRVLDELGAASLKELNAFLTEPTNRIDYMLERGQVQFINNHVVAHSRTAYEDYKEQGRRRHLVRLWLRSGDRRQFRG